MQHRMSQDGRGWRSAAVPARGRWIWLALVALLWAGAAHAQTIVTTSGDLAVPDPLFVNLRTAITIENGSVVEGRIAFDPSLLSSTVTLENGALDTIDVDMTIDGSPLGLVTVAGGAAGTFLTVGDGFTLTLQEVVLQGGQSVIGTGSTLILDTSANLSMSTDFSGDGDFVKRGAGTITFTGANNNRTGETIIDAGGLVGSANLGIKGDITVKSGATVEIQSLTASDTYTGAITGGGMLIKSGTDLLLLDNVLNDYSGGTVVNGGTLSGDGVSLAGPFVINGSASTIVFNLTADDTLDITGDGIVEKMDAQVLTVTGSGFTGLVNVQGGRLVGTPSSIQGDVALMTANTELEFTAGGNYSGDVTGTTTSIIRKSGSGNLSLAGDNTGFDGTLNIGEGNVQGNTTSLPRTIQFMNPSSDLIFDQGNDGSFNGTITGTGRTVVKSGGGTLTFPTDQNLSAETSINAGRLDLTNGSTLTTTSLAVNGGTLGGNGTVIGPVTASGTISPGRAGTPIDPGALDTLSVMGGVAFGAGSILSAGLLQNGMSDTLAVTGPVAIDPGGGSTLGLDFVIVSPVTTTLLTSAGGITGQFADPDFAFVSIVQDYSNPNLLSVTVSPGAASQAASTPNQVSVAAAMDSPGATAPLAAAVAVLTGSSLTTAEGQAVIDSVSGELITAFAQPRLTIARRTHAAAADRVRDIWWHGAEAVWDTTPPTVSDFAQAQGVLPFAAAGTALARKPDTPHWNSWLDGYGVWGDLDGNLNSAPVDYRVAGLTLGIDYRFGDSWLLGGAFGWGHTNVDLTTRVAAGDSDTYHGTLYAGYASPLFHVALSGRYGRTNMNTVRPIDYLAFSQTAFGKFGGNGYGARIETGINLVRWKRIDFQPFVGFDWELLKYDAFNEFGSAAYNMHFSDVDFDSYLLEVGLRLRAPTDLDDGTWIYPEIEVGYRHEFGEVGRLASSFFIADSLRTRMLVRGAEPARDSFVGAVRWAVSITDDAEAFAGYNVWADSRLVEHQATGGVRIRW